MTNQLIPNEALEAVVTALEFHLTDKSQDSGCALRCGFDGDDMALHLAQHILEAAAPHMLAEAWEAWDANVEIQRLRAELAKFEALRPYTIEDQRQHGETW